MGKIPVLHPDRCTGCGLCELMCSVSHTESSDPSRSRIRILRREEKGFFLQMICQQCEDAACIAACPVSAISRNATTGAIEIDGEACILCQECVAACPFKAIHLDEADEKIITCDLCSGDPQCEKCCETKAVEFVEKDSAATKRNAVFSQEFQRLLKIAEGC